ncbi:Rv2578c family radical SAM protein [Gordonia alkaliphila]|uniref:Rv2578c family radical SAM protein n=1 Tax=Gordonia alkaliphila TaxID=1053547 RepID=UPI001FF6CBCF|nr:Rv2578c family radical SAM protein [Gordonia alkaliphila]MCK0438786.1 Rv2578c family radical SAM protein [Gordonia alkaliphila]
MRWSGQSANTDDGGLPGLDRAGLVRTVETPEFAGITFHEVLARSALNKLPDGGPMPFRYTVNTMRGCSHACRYCFARPTHEYLDLNAGLDFDSQLVVKLNVAAVLRKELRRRSWQRETVALGTNTDPYQRAEGRYRLMPGVITALAESGTPLSILTKGTLLRRDIPLLRTARGVIDIDVGVSLAMLDDDLRKQLDPGAPSPRARLELITALAEAGFRPHVMVAPVVPYLTDDTAALDALLGALAEAGAERITAFPLHLRGATAGIFMEWLGEHHPALVRRYRSLYSRSGYVRAEYSARLREKLAPLVARHGLGRADAEATSPSLATPSPTVAAAPYPEPALTLF